MIRRVIVSRFKKFHLFDSNLEERMVIAGPNNSGKSTLLQVLATWAELGEIWLRSIADLGCQDYQRLHRVEVNVASLGTLALSSFDQLWHNRDTREPITIRVLADDWDVGFELSYQDATTAIVEPLTDISAPQLDAYANNPPKALYVPSLSGLDIDEPEYSEGVVTTRLAHGKGGMVLRNMVQATSRDDAKWRTLQNTIKSFFGFELSRPSGVDPITVRYRHSVTDHWYDLLNGAAGFLQTLLVQSALLHSSATLFLIDEPDAHLHVLLKAKMYRLIREHCDENDCQVLIATHSGSIHVGNQARIRLFSDFFPVFPRFRVRLSRTFPQRSPQAAASGRAEGPAGETPAGPPVIRFRCRTDAVRPAVRRRPPSGPPTSGGRGEGRWRSRPACA